MNAPTLSHPQHAANQAITQVSDLLNLIKQDLNNLDEAQLEDLLGVIRVIKASRQLGGVRCTVNRPRIHQL